MTQNAELTGRLRTVPLERRVMRSGDGKWKMRTVFYDGDASGNWRTRAGNAYPSETQGCCRLAAVVRGAWRGLRAKRCRNARCALRAARSASSRGAFWTKYNHDANEEKPAHDSNDQGRQLQE